MQPGIVSTSGFLVRRLTPALCVVVYLGAPRLGHAVQLAGGAHHTCAVLDTGEVRCWGLGDSGQLGHGNTSNIGDNEAPALVDTVDVGGAVVQITAGTEHTCALLDTGEVRCWGEGDAGRLGYGNTNDIGDDETPASAGNVDIGGVAVQITAGAAHTCALLDTGMVRCWGQGSHGRLGYGNTGDVGDDEVPASAGTVDIGGTAVQIAAGELHTCALLDTGAVSCWGFGRDGRLGYGNTSDVGDDEAPASVGTVSAGGIAVQIATGGAHTCAVFDTGTLRCWGSVALGYGRRYSLPIGDDEVPASVAPVSTGSTVVRVTAGFDHTCALLAGGRVRCWGEGYTGQLGYGNTNAVGDDEVPSAVGTVSVGGVVVDLVAGGFHTCALLDTDAVRCWGSARQGQLGYGNRIRIGDDEPPSRAGNVPYD